jgi:hypothetical protein
MSDSPKAAPKPALTVSQLHAITGAAIDAGRGDEPVQLMTVTAGMTCADNVVWAGAAQEYDGRRFWLQIDEGST